MFLNKHQDLNIILKKDQKSRVLRSILSDTREQQEVDSRTRLQLQVQWDQEGMLLKLLAILQARKTTLDGLYLKLEDLLQGERKLIRIRLMTLGQLLEHNHTPRTNPQEFVISELPIVELWVNLELSKITCNQVLLLRCTTLPTD